MTEQTEQRMAAGTWRLYYDLTGYSNDQDGRRNPAWVKASDGYTIVGGDGFSGVATVQFVAVHTVEGTTGEHRGRDWQGRAVVLVPVEDGSVHACEPSTVTGRCGVCGAVPRRADGSPDASLIVAAAVRRGEFQ